MLASKFLNKRTSKKFLIQKFEKIFLNFYNFYKETLEVIVYKTKTISIMTPQVYINNHLNILTQEETYNKVSQQFKDSINDSNKEFFFQCLLLLSNKK